MVPREPVGAWGWPFELTETAGMVDVDWAVVRVRMLAAARRNVVVYMLVIPRCASCRNIVLSRVSVLVFEG